MKDDIYHLVYGNSHLKSVDVPREVIRAISGDKIVQNYSYFDNKGDSFLQFSLPVAYPIEQRDVKKIKIVDTFRLAFFDREEVLVDRNILVRSLPFNWSGWFYFGKETDFLEFEKSLETSPILMGSSERDLRHPTINDMDEKEKMRYISAKKLVKVSYAVGAFDTGFFPLESDDIILAESAKNLPNYSGKVNFKKDMTKLEKFALSA